MKKPNVYAMIPARYGSERLKTKNLALINGKPMISYAIDAAISSRVFDEVIVNSEHQIFGEIASRHSVKFYQRPEELGRSETRSDAVVADFMLAHAEADIVAWVNPTSPLQTAMDVAEILEYFIRSEKDSLVSSETKQVHCLYKDNPINFNINEAFEKTQDLVSVEALTYSVMVWRVSSFLDYYTQFGHAMCCGNFGVYPADKRTSFIVKNKEDLMLADSLMKAQELQHNVVEYDPIISR